MASNVHIVFDIHERSSHLLSQLFTNIHCWRWQSHEWKAGEHRKRHTKNESPFFSLNITSIPQRWKRDHRYRHNFSIENVHDMLWWAKVKVYMFFVCNFHPLNYDHRYTSRVSVSVCSNIRCISMRRTYAVLALSQNEHDAFNVLIV